MYLHRENGQPPAEDPVGQLDPGAGPAAAAATNYLRFEEKNKKKFNGSFISRTFTTGIEKEMLAE